MNTRKGKRIKKSLLVDISRKGIDQMGVTVDISRKGMCIATTKPVRKRSRLEILLAADDEIYTITGLVVWKKKQGDAEEGQTPVGLGIEIEKAPPKYRKFVAAARKKSLPAKKNRRGR
jgi:hypothetical protein